MTDPMTNPITYEISSWNNNKTWSIYKTKDGFEYCVGIFSTKEEAERQLEAYRGETQ